MYAVVKLMDSEMSLVMHSGLSKCLQRIDELCFCYFARFCSRKKRLPSSFPDVRQDASASNMT